MIGAFDLSGKAVLITGGAGRLGRQMSEALAEAGANVIIGSRDLEASRDLAAELSDRYQECVGVRMDATDQETVVQVVKSIVNDFDSLDSLVNNAYFGSAAPFETMDVTQWRMAFEGALTTTFICSQAAAEQMKEQGSGSIINISSIYGMVSPHHDIYGRTGINSPPNYGAAKAGLIQFTKWLATFLGPHGIRVNALSPGGFYDRSLESRPDYDLFVQKYSERTALKRMGGADDLRGAIVFLASDASGYMTGQNLVIDGGWTAY